MFEKVIIINNEYSGLDKVSGKTVIEIFLRKLLASLIKPEVIIFYNSGTKYLVKNSEILPILEALQLSGVDLIACGMCVDNSCKNKDALKVGRITAMDEIVSILMKTNTVISL